MNKKKLLALFVSSAFLFAGCGEDSGTKFELEDPEEEESSSSEDDEEEPSDEESSSSKANKKSSSSTEEEEEVSSSSKKEEKSSSSVKESEKSSASKEGKSSSSTAAEPKSSSSSESSSEKSSSSSVEVPKGAHAATLDDMEKNLLLSDVAGVEVFLSTGSKKGVMALRIPDELWAVTYTDFENGTVVFSSKKGGLQAVSSEEALKVKKEFEKDDGIKLSFIVDDDGKLKYAVNDSKTYKIAEKATVTLPSGKVSKAENVANKVYSCKNGDTTKVFTFLDGKYIVEDVVKEKTVSWIGGNFDIQRGTMLMLPEYYNGGVYSMYTYLVGTDDSMTGSNNKALSCTVKEREAASVDKSKLVQNWQGTEGGVSWDFYIKSNGEYTLKAYEGNKNVEHKGGSWELYGDFLMMRNQGCLDPKKCTACIKGEVKDLTADGFKFKHTDPDTPTIPYTWVLPEVE